MQLFAKHEDQRQWIIEEVMSSLIKLPDLKKNRKQFRLHNGKSIHTVSALLLQLVQGCSHGVREEAIVIAESRVLGGLVGGVGSLDVEENEEVVVEDGEKEMRLWSTSLDSATRSAKAIIQYLMHR